jgi:hypothetical protein
MIDTYLQKHNEDSIPNGPETVAMNVAAPSGPTGAQSGTRRSARARKKVMLIEI